MKKEVVNFGKEDLQVIRVSCASDNPFVFIRVSRLYHRVFLSDIIYLESDGRYSKIHTTKRHFRYLMTIHNVYDLLPDDKFIRINRGIIVNLAWINVFNRTHVVLSNGLMLPFSGDARENLLKIIESSNTLQSGLNQ